VKFLERRTAPDSTIVNPTKKTILERLGKLDKAIEPLATICKRYLRYCSAIDPIDETLLIGHQPWKGPQAYAVRIFPAAKKSWFGKYSLSHGLKFPSACKSILLSVNGINAFGLSLYGIPPSMVKDPPLLNRSRAQCLDIGSANRNWKRAFPGQEARFHFGGRNYDSTQNSGYFWDPNGEIIAVLKTGKVVGSWTNFQLFFAEELQAAEHYHRSQTPEEWWQ
jgi:hypothetical protein